MSTSTDTTPERYRPEPRKWENKDWLYEQYWGQLRSTEAMAEDTDTCGQIIRETMDELGIPRRDEACHGRSRVGPFNGFYNGDDGPGRVSDDEGVTVDWGKQYE